MPATKKTAAKATSKARKAPTAPPRPKSATERVNALRERRAALGLVRLDLYAHPDDHAAIKALADGLARNRGWR